MRPRGLAPALLVIVAAATLPSCAPWQPVGPKATTAPDHEIAEEKPTAAAVEMVDVAGLGPYFDDVFGGEAARALAEDRVEEAMRLFDEIARQVSDPVLTPRARFLAAYLAQRSGDDARALADLPGLALQLPAAADTARATAALAALRLKKFETAIDFAREVDADGTLAPDAALIAADSLRQLERWREAADTYRDRLARWPGARERPRAESRLVECLARLALADDHAPDQALASEALELIDRLRAQGTTDTWTRAAITHESALRQALGLPPIKTVSEKPAAVKAYEKASKLLNKMRNREAEKSFAKVIRLATKGGELGCQARLKQAIAVQRQRQHGRAAPLFEKVAGDCSAPTIQVRALYMGGRAYVAADQHEEAIRLFTVVEEEHADHSYADDARLRAARSHLALGDRESFLELITSLPEIYPQGDMRSEALWFAAHDSLKQGELDSAYQVLTSYYELFPNEEGWYIAGRSGYWLGRVEELLGQTEQATARYEQVIASAPLTHYMVLAHARLTAIDSDRAAALISRLAPPGGELSARFPKHLLVELPALATGIELLRLGLTTRARRELDRLLGDPDTTADAHWIAAALFRRMGRFNEATQAASGATKDWRRRYPSGQDLVRWTLAYPTAFEDEVEAAAAESGVDRALLWAVMREESGFNAKVESWANAIGLMQLIMPTAKSMGKKIDVKVNKKALRTPETNIRLGAAYLAFLSEKFDSQVALAIAGYNAGEGAVARWLEDHPDAQLDEFVEMIPYQQTRGYTKRVLASLATYKFLYEENRPLLIPEMELP
jgi:soluble lytic murein transglycosylase